MLPNCVYSRLYTLNYDLVKYVLILCTLYIFLYILRIYTQGYV